MLEGIHFVYDGISSEDMKLLNVQISTGLYEEQFVADREIQEISIRGNDKPYFQGVKSAPLVLNLTFAFEETYNEEKIREVARWLCQDRYKAFYTDSNPNRIYYCMLSSSSKLLHNGLNAGYVQIQMKCDAPYTYTPQYTSVLYDLSSNDVDGTTIDFTNYGDLPCSPELWISKVGNGDVSIINTTNNGTEFKFTSLLDTEELYVDCENEHIESLLPDELGGEPLAQYRYDNFNDNYLEMVRGVNKLIVKGNCKLKFRYYFKTLQG